MEYRSLQATSGGSTYIVSLPKEWVEYQKLEKGRPLAIEERMDGALVVYPNPDVKKPKTTARLTRRNEPLEDLLRVIIGNYVNGVDRIGIHGDITWEEEKTLREWLSSLLLGATISREDEILLVTIAIDEENIPPQKMLKRAHNIAYWMYVGASSQMVKGDSSLCKDIRDRDKEVDKLHVVCRRGLNKAIIDTDFRAKIGLRRREMADHFRVIDYVELVADVCCELARRAEILSEHKISKEDTRSLEPMLTEVGELYNQSVRAFLNEDMATANEVIGSVTKVMKRDIPRMMVRIVPKQKGKEATAALSDSLNSILMIAEKTKHISEITIDRCVRD